MKRRDREEGGKEKKEKEKSDGRSYVIKISQLLSEGLLTPQLS